MDQLPVEQRHFSDFVLRFRHWLDRPDPGSAVVRELLDLSDEDLAHFISLHQPFAVRAAVILLLETSHRSLSAAPRDSVTLSRLATRLAVHDRAAEGDAWKEYGEALLSAGDYRDANAACLRAGAIYNSLRDRRHRVYERTHLKLIQSQVSYFLGDVDRALELADTAAMELELMPSKKKEYVRARTTYATILVGVQRLEEGLRALEECAEVARQEDDREVLASLVNNIGGVHARLGNLTEAKECYRTALQGFVSLGLKTEMPRVHGGLARILMQEGRYNEAISEHYKARAAYLELEMPVVAAEVTLYIIETLFIAGRMNDIPSLSVEAMDTFSKAHLPREAAKALAYVNACAQRNTLTRDTVEDVREFFHRLQADASLEFDEFMTREGGAE